MLHDVQALAILVPGVGSHGHQSSIEISVTFGGVRITFDDATTILLLRKHLYHSTHPVSDNRGVHLLHVLCSTVNARCREAR